MAGRRKKQAATAPEASIPVAPVPQETPSWKLPSKVTILGTEYRVKTSMSIKHEGAYGETIPDKKLIKISKFDDVESSKSTLLHEMLHAALHQSGQSFLFNDKQEEALVRMFEQFLYPMVDFEKLNGVKPVAKARQ